MLVRRSVSNDIPVYHGDRYFVAQKTSNHGGSEASSHLTILPPALLPGTAHVRLDGRLAAWLGDRLRRRNNASGLCNNANHP